MYARLLIQTLETSCEDVEMVRGKNDEEHEVEDPKGPYKVLYHESCFCRKESNVRKYKTMDFSNYGEVSVEGNR